MRHEPAWQFALLYSLYVGGCDASLIPIFGNATVFYYKLYAYLGNTFRNDEDGVFTFHRRNFLSPRTNSGIDKSNIQLGSLRKLQIPTFNFNF